jgi:hypothetical protein
MNRDVDVMRLLAGARPAELDPDEGAAERVLAAVMARASAPRHPAPAARARRTAMLALGGGTATVAAALLALLALQALPGAARPAPAVPPATTAASARDVLLAAARQPAVGPASGRYWHETTRTSSVVRAGQGDAAYLVEIGTQIDDWFAANASDRSWFVSQSLGGRPLTPDDEAAWRRAGAPDHFDVRVDKGGGTVATGTFDARPGQPVSAPVDRQSSVFDLGRPGISLSDLAQLPADPAALRARLAELHRRGDPAATDAPKDLDPWLFQAASSLLNAPVSPEVRSAALRVLADLPGVTNAGGATDPLGRTGVAIAETSSSPLSGTVQRQLVIDPATGRLLATQTVVQRPGPAEPWARPGLRISSITTVSAGWTDAMPPMGSSR